MHNTTMKLLLLLSGIVIQSNLIGSDSDYDDPERVALRQDQRKKAPHQFSSTHSSAATAYPTRMYADSDGIGYPAGALLNPLAAAPHSNRQSSATAHYTPSATQPQLAEKEAAMRALAVAFQQTMPDHVKSAGLKECFSKEDKSMPGYIQQALQNTLQNLARPALPNYPDSSADGAGSAAAASSSDKTDRKHSESPAADQQRIEYLESYIKIGAGIGTGAAIALNKLPSRWSYTAAPLAAASVAAGFNAKRLATATITALDKYKWLSSPSKEE